MQVIDASSDGRQSQRHFQEVPVTSLFAPSTFPAGNSTSRFIQLQQHQQQQHQQQQQQYLSPLQLIARAEDDPTYASRAEEAFQESATAEEMTPSQRLANQLLAKYWTRASPQDQHLHASGGVHSVGASALVLDPLVSSNRKLKEELKEARRSADEARREMQSQLERVRIEHEQKLLEREAALLQKEESRLRQKQLQNHPGAPPSLLQPVSQSSWHQQPFKQQQQQSIELSPELEQPAVRTHRPHAASSHHHQSSTAVAPQVSTNDPQVDEMVQSLDDDSHCTLLQLMSLRVNPPLLPVHPPAR